MAKLKGTALSEKIKELIIEYGGQVIERTRTFHTACPLCGRSDKFSILKDNGASVCYRGKCSFGKKWFEDYLVIVANISREAAVKKLSRDIAENVDTSDLNIDEIFNEDEPIQQVQTELSEIEWPLDHFVSLRADVSPDGCEYIASRGIPPAIMQQYGALYSVLWKRIMFPIKKDGKVVGYQGRTISRDPSAIRMLNSKNQFRESSLMFEDRLNGLEHAVLTEGPFDAIKFHLTGGNVCSMGKVVSDKQLKILLDKGIKKLYLALDDDAVDIMEEIAFKLEIPCYWVKIPETCRKRCAMINKKPDFGECTFEECQEAIKEAKLIDGTDIMVYL